MPFTIDADAGEEADIPRLSPSIRPRVPTTAEVAERINPACLSNEAESVEEARSVLVINIPLTRAAETGELVALLNPNDFT